MRDVFEKVFDGLTAGGETDEALGDLVASPARAAFGGGGDAAEAGGVGEEFGFGEKCFGSSLDLR